MRKTLVVAAVLPLVALGCGSKDPEPEIDGVVIERSAGNDHVETDVQYDQAPPSSGDHNPLPATCGFYSEPIPDEFAVHSLEHAAVWIAFEPDLPVEDIDKLREIAADRDKVLVSPYPGIESPIVVVAWERRLELDSVDDPRLEKFVDGYEGGDHAPEPNAACQGAGNPE